MTGGNTTKHVLRCHDKSKTSIVIERNTLPISFLANIHATIYNIDRRKVNEQRRAVKRTISIVFNILRLAWRKSHRVH